MLNYLLAVLNVSVVLVNALPATLHTRQTSCCSVNAGYDPLLAVNEAKLLSSHSWEFGTASEALLELFNPELSVFSPDPFPGGSIPSPSVSGTQSLAYAIPNIRTNNVTLIDGDGAVGDPASLGVSAILIGQTNATYFDAATRQADHVLYEVPKWWNGAISHREAYAELWADFIYMAPPFLAYYAVATDNATLMDVTVQQCGLYRQILQANTSSSYRGLWEHIVGPMNQDVGLWSTGNGWAAMGMTRVLATVRGWGKTSSRLDLQFSLMQWIGEIIHGAMAVDKQNGLLRNYLNNATWFGETSGTSALTAATYRLAVMQNTYPTKNGGHWEQWQKYRMGKAELAWADANRLAVAAHVNASGIASPAVNPLGWGDLTPYTNGSPEGESFLILMYAAYRDCVEAGVC